MSEMVLFDECVGETRACLFNELGEPVEWAVQRWSEKNTRVVEGAVYSSRVLRVDRGLNAAFVELPMGEAGFLPFGKKGCPEALHEGAKIRVQITREALPGKGPNVSMAADADDAAEDTPPSLLERMYLPAGIDIIEADVRGRARLDAALDEALAKVVPIVGGGDICIEPTRALVAIDVDTGSSPILGGKFNYKAAGTAFRQLRLRSLGGIVVIDFAPMRTKNERAALTASINAMAKADPARIDVLPLSRFGTLELLRRRRARSPREIILDKNGRKSVESIAIEALRTLENLGRINGGARLVLRAGFAVASWLSEDDIGWHDAMAERIGARFTVEQGDDLPARQYEVFAK